MDRGPIRESGSSDTHRPTPCGEFDGYTRRQAMTDLLAKHEPPADPTRDVPAHRFWARFSRVAKLAAFLFLVNTHADAQTIKIIWSGPKLTPQQAADILRPSSFVSVPPCTECDGPYSYTAPYTGEYYEEAFLRAARFAHDYDRLRGRYIVWPRSREFRPIVVGGRGDQRPRRDHPRRDR